MYYLLFQFREHAWTGFRMNDRDAINKAFQDFSAGFSRISGVDSDGAPWAVNTANVTFMHLKNFEDFQRVQQAAIQQAQQQQNNTNPHLRPGGYSSGRN